MSNKKTILNIDRYNQCTAIFWKALLNNNGNVLVGMNVKIVKPDVEKISNAIAMKDSKSANTS